MNAKTLKMKILRAKAKAKKRRDEREEKAMQRMEKASQRAALESERKAALAKRRQAALKQKHVAKQAEETARKSQKKEAKEELKSARELRSARLLTERELRREQLKPYTEAISKVVKTGVSLGKTAQRGLEKLAEEGKTSGPEKPLDLSIDLGFGTPHKTKTTPRPVHKEPPIDVKIDLGL